MEKSVEKKSYLILMILLTIIAFALGYYTFAYWHTPKEQKALQNAPHSQTLVLNAIPLKSENVPFTKRYIGYVRAIHEAKIQPFINGFIEKIMVQGGDFVKKDDLLLVLDQAQYRAELAAAYANILKAQASFTNAKIYYNRLQKAGTKAISPTEQDNAKAQLLTARAELEQANANYALAEVNLGYTVIKAPISGLVGHIDLTTGNYVSPETEVLISIMQYDPIRVVFSITDKEYLEELNKPHPFAGDKISLLLPDGKIFPYNGTFQYADNAVNKQTNSIAVYVNFKNIEKTLTPNAYVTVLVEKIFKNAVIINKDNVYLEEDGNFVYLIKNGKLIKEKINILASTDNYFITSGNFANGDFLVTQNINPADINQPANPALQTDDTSSATKEK